MYPKNGALACVGKNVWSFWYRWNDFLVKITRFFCVVAKITFLFCQTNIFLASVLRRKMEDVRGHKVFQGITVLSKNILNVRNFRFRFFNVLKIYAINNIVTNTSIIHRNYNIIRWFFRISATYVQSESSDCVLKRIYFLSRI